jgi:hypothetical protein
MLGFRGPAQPSPMLGDALNAGYLYLEVRCLGCDRHQTVALDVVRRPKTTPIHELERYMRCRDCSQVRGYAYKRSPSAQAREGGLSDHKLNLSQLSQTYKTRPGLHARSPKTPAARSWPSVAVTTQALI